jgi:hypothetical protein
MVPNGIKIWRQDKNRENIVKKGSSITIVHGDSGAERNENYLPVLLVLAEIYQETF